MDKKGLDSLNFSNYSESGTKLTYKENPNGDNKEFFHEEEITPDTNSQVYNSYNEIKKLCDTINDNVHVGVISHGVHSDHYKEMLDIEFSNPIDKGVMFVYDIPHNNLNCSYKYYDQFWKNKPEYIEDDLKNIPFKELLAKTWWRIHDWKKEESSFIEIAGQAKAYGRFIASLINEYQLNNLYTTNLVRYEIFNIEKYKDKDRCFDKAINLGTILDKAKKEKMYGDIISKCFNNIFLQEVKLCKPEVIFATSAAYSVINDNDNIDKVKTAAENDVIKVVKVLHPAAQAINKENRRCCNVNVINKALFNAGVIDATKANKVYEQYLDFPKNSKK